MQLPQVAFFYQASLSYVVWCTSQTNTFQCILATGGGNSYVTFIYADIQWTTGDASGGTNGFGGTKALAGINAGDGVNFMTVPESLTSDIINVTLTSNVCTPGVWMFKVDGGMFRILLSQ